MSKSEQSESEKQNGRDGPGFRVRVVGSNPAGPTISEKIHALSTKIILK
jgi:hypothetical protein